MNNRQRQNAILHYEAYDRMPVVHFGYWKETIQKWVTEGHISEEESTDVRDNSPHQNIISERLGFDYNFSGTFGGRTSLFPWFEETLLETLPDGTQKVRDANGAIVLKKPGVVSIPAEIDHTLKDRASWEKDFLHRLQYSDERINFEALSALKQQNETRQTPLGVYCGSLMGEIRNWLGVVGLSYLYADDEDLYIEIVDTLANLQYKILEKILASGVAFDFAHYWEDICYNHGPLVNPSAFAEIVGPHYKKITELLHRYGIKIISLDCDGCIDSLIPTWFSNGVNTMFPIEVGTWNANIKPWREKYGRELRGVGGMDKKVFAYDYAAVDREIERLKPLVALGGFIPCVDHRIPPDAKWETVQYYCEKMRETF